MRIAQWLNTARIMGILYTLFVFSLGFLINDQIQYDVYGLDLFQYGAMMSLVLIIQCTFIGILLEAWRQHHIDGAISRRLARIISRPLHIFVSLVYLLIVANTLSFFFEGSDFWRDLRNFLYSGWPLIVIGIAIVLAWRWEWIGTLNFFLTGFFLLLIIPYDLSSMLKTFLLLSGPCLLLAVGFWLNTCWHEEIQAALRSESISLEQPAG